MPRRRQPPPRALDYVTPAIESLDDAAPVRLLIITDVPEATAEALARHHAAQGRAPIIHVGFAPWTAHWPMCRQPHRTAYLVVTPEMMARRYDHPGPKLKQLRKKMRRTLRDDIIIPHPYITRVARDRQRLGLTGVLQLFDAAPFSSATGFSGTQPNAGLISIAYLMSQLLADPLIPHFQLPWVQQTRPHPDSLGLEAFFAWDQARHLSGQLSDLLTVQAGDLRPRL